MKNDVIYNKFKDFLEIYKDYFISNEELWNNHFEKVIQYIKENNKLPSSESKDKDIQILGRWFLHQKECYKKKILIMKNDVIYNKFKDFIETYKEYLLQNKEGWNNNLKKVINYIKENNKLPTHYDKNKEINSLSVWIGTQKKNYKIRKEIMKYDIIYNKFKNFLEIYKEYFISNEEIWNNHYEKVINYIKENNKLPLEKHKSKDIKFLGKWLSCQKTNYRLKNRIMKNNTIYNKFKEFLETYKEYLLSNEEKWYNYFEKLIKYIKENNKLPSSESKDKDVKILGSWFLNQKNKCEFFLVFVIFTQRDKKVIKREL
jgi:hypothetical protein